MSPVEAFYRGARDRHGRSLDEILAQPDGWLEATHDYIQLLFPLPERSPYNPGAATLVAADIAAFRADPALRQALRRALARMRAFYRLDPPAARLRPWIRPGNHNFLRLTRILRSLHLLGCEAEAAALLADLETLAATPEGAVFGDTTLAHWRAGAGGDLPSRVGLPS